MRRLHHRWLFFSLLLWSLLSEAQPSCAQDVADPAATEAAYEAALTRALEAHVAADYILAERAMREAHALSPSARTWRGLGVILYAQGRYLDAIEPLEQALRNETKALGPELRQGAEELLARIWQRVARLTLIVEPSDSRVSIDDAEPQQPGVERVLMPGEHRIVVSAPGRAPYALTLRAQPGSRDTLHVVLAPNPKPSEQPVAFAPPVAGTGERREAHGWTPLARNALLASGGALVLAGGASWLTGFLRYRDLRDECRAMDGGGCNEHEARERYDEKRIFPLTVTGAVLMSVGAATLLTVGSLELWRFQASRRHPSARARLMLRGTGLQLHASF